MNKNEFECKHLCAFTPLSEAKEISGEAPTDELIPLLSHNCSESSPPEGEISQSGGLKNKHPAEEEEEEEEEDGSDADKHEAKRLKFDEKEEAETESKGEKESSSSEPESMSETPESSEDSSEPEQSGTCDTPAASEDNGRCSCTSTVVGLCTRWCEAATVNGPIKSAILIN